jgi:two-component system, NtrC family, sensor kinase
MNDLVLLEKKIKREKAARKEAEMLLEVKSLELYKINQKLQVRTEKIADQKEKLQNKIEELEQTRLQLVQSEKMAVVGQLAAGVAHEINNPVGYISSNINTLDEYFVDICAVLKKQKNCIQQFVEKGEISDKTMSEVLGLQQDIDLDYILSDIDQLLSDSIEGAERVKNIVANLSEFSHVNSPGLVEEDINELLEKTINVSWNELKYKAEVIKELVPLPKVLCHGGKMAQVFLNLLVNAAQAIHGRGEIRVRTGVDGAMVWVEVSDTGEGISKKNMEKIFDPFFTTKEVGKGTGLGLHMVRSVMDNHGGKILVSSEVEKGTTFKIIFPIDGDEISREYSGSSRTLY